MAKRRRTPAAHALELGGSKRPQLRKVRRGGWTIAKREAFLGMLVQTCNIAASLRAVKMSETGLRELRQRDGAFRAAMRAAIGEAHVNLTLDTLEKTMSGVVKTTTAADGKVSKVHEYPLAIALGLLRLHKGGAAEAEAEADAPAELVDETVKRLLRKIERVAAREKAAREGAGEGGGDAESDSPSPRPSPPVGRGGEGGEGGGDAESDSPSPRPSPPVGRGGEGGEGDGGGR